MAPTFYRALTMASFNSNYEDLKFEGGIIGMEKAMPFNSNYEDLKSVTKKEKRMSVRLLILTMRI